MPLVDFRKDGPGYANWYSRVNPSEGTQFLSFRDVPGLIEKHVKGTTTLDYGCGAAKSAMSLKALGLHVDGVDVNEEMIKLAKERDPAGDYRLIKGGEIPVGDNHYDLVFSRWVLIEIGSKEELLKTMREFARVMKAEGTSILVVLSEDYFRANWLTAHCLHDDNVLESGGSVKVHFPQTDLTVYCHFWKDEDYQEVIKGAGLRVVEKINPLGRDEDGIPWKTERTMSPYSIYVVKKANS
nr:PREDICTED: uncharacterized protein LOC109032255 [Bemisia tabaci]XP_018899842.1 PREDICTED: uncharacterized protein LOC109032255 [Bemisia tabaci]